MGEELQQQQKNRWNWEVSGFESTRSSSSLPVEQQRQQKSASVSAAPLLRKHSISTTSFSDSPSQQFLAFKLHTFRNKLKHAREDYLELRREASDLQEYCNGEFNRAIQCLGILSETASKQEKVSLEAKTKISKLLHLEKSQIAEINQRDSMILTLQEKIQTLVVQLNDAREASSKAVSESVPATDNGPSEDSSAVTKKLEEELLKRDALIERLHEENEKLFDKLTEKTALVVVPQAPSPSPKRMVRNQASALERNHNAKERSPDVVSNSSSTVKPDGTVALVKAGSENMKMTPAGEYLTAALNGFDPEQFDSLAAIIDGANKLLMLVLAAVIKAGASREHEILAEIKNAVFSFIRKMEPKRVMDTMLVSRVRILYIRSLLARSPELQSIKVQPVESFLERPNIGHTRSTSRGSSPGRSSALYDPRTRSSHVDDLTPHFKVNIKQERKSKFSSVVLKLRGIDQETWRQHVTGEKLREITEEAKSFATGNKALAALFVHTPAGELQRQIRSWLAENFDFLSVTGDDAIGGSTGQLELLSTAIMDGWMAGLGDALPPKTDALGQLLSEYAKRVYSSQLQHLKDIAGTLATEDADDSAQVAKLRSALESVDHKRRKILQQMKGDVTLSTLEDGSPSIQNPSTAAEDARLASLISLDSILKQVKVIQDLHTLDIIRQSSVSKLSISKKKSILGSLEELEERMPSLLDIDHPCAQKHIAEAQHMVESIPEEDDSSEESMQSPKLHSDLGLTAETDVAQWNVLQFNTGSSTPFIIKCGSNSKSELVIKADAKVQEPGEIVRTLPRPTVLENMSLEEIKHVFSQLPEALTTLSLARTSDGTRARYSRLYRTLAMKVPSLRDLVSDLEKGGVLKDVKS